ncbi:MAG: peptidylprolyl isomerase [Muribaculaceae bacterium]|nr:peptidylprolyl isomerase [Muribaculaceae bacterium]
MIGDQPIYRSDIEQAYQEYLDERVPINGDPYCVIPELLAIQRLYLHQADIDTVEVQPAQVQQEVERQLNYLYSQLGSKEKVEQYFGRSIADIRAQYTNSMTDRYRVQTVQHNLTQNVSATPADVRRYFNSLPKDSIPFVPMQVEVQVIAINPVVPQQEIDDVKARLREFADRVNSGDADFSTLAILYSEDGSAQRGGELGFMGRGQLVPEYAAVAFNLNDPKKVSKIVESEYGFHIIQLIEKRGDRINTRHILLRPKVAQKDINEAIVRLDTLRSDIIDGKITFNDACVQHSQDKDTRFSHGVMVNDDSGDTRFEMSQLPAEIARAVADLEPGQISQPFVMMNPKRNREQVVIVMLTNRIAPHQANLSDDYQLLKDMYEAQKKQDILDKWLADKIKDTYIRVEDGWRGCDFVHDGWIK